jgi:uncharacterized protein
VRWPVLAPFVLLFFAMILRIIDIFVLRLDERLGEIILSKSLGFALVAGYVWWSGQHLSAIGLHSRKVGAALAIGAGLTLTAFAIASIVQILSLAPDQSLTIQIIDTKAGVTGGVTFVVLLIAGNVINSFMEEGLFRGVMLTHFLQRMRFPAANLLQAVLFAAWHVVWPIKNYLSGGISVGEAFTQAAFLLSGAFIAGLVFGYLFWRTASLWAPMAAHFLNNILHGLLQVQNNAGDLQSAVLLPVVAVIAMAILTPAVGPLSSRFANDRLIRFS